MDSPEVSVMASLATAAVVYGIYQVSLPSAADVRSIESGNPDIAASERVAAWTAAGVVGAVSLIARDPNIFIVGGAMVIILSWMNRHANLVDNVTHKAVSTVPASLATPRVSQAEAPSLYSAPSVSAYEATF